MRKQWLLLWAMIVKEVRTTLRERHQVLGLIITLLVLGVAVGTLSYKLRPAMQGMKSQAASQPASGPAVAGPSAGEKGPWPHVDSMIVRWVSIGVGSSVSLFFSLGYVMAATLATFAGEKDGKTLEILLASPVSDTRLFFSKCLSVLLPTWGIGYLLLLVPTIVGAIFMHSELAEAPVSVVLYVLVFSLPVTLLIEASIVAIGAAISVKAETLKGANQVFGGVFFGIFFGIGYGMPLLMRAAGLSKPLLGLARRWLQTPFAMQYGILLMVLSIPVLVFLLIGRSLFRRDRLLA